MILVAVRHARRGRVLSPCFVIPVLLLVPTSFVVPSATRLCASVSIQAETSGVESPASKPAALPALPGGMTAATPSSAASQPTVDEQFPKIIALANAGELDAAITDLEELAVAYPDDDRVRPFLIQLLAARGRQLGEGGDCRQAGKIFRRAIAAIDDVLRNVTEEESAILKTRFAAVFYEQARCLARSHRINEALDAMETALQWGLDASLPAANDPALATLATHERYSSMLVARPDAASQALLTQTRKELQAFNTFPFLLSTVDSNGQAVRLKELRGKVVIVDFWGTWCAPCRKEIPHFIELHDKYADQGLEIIGLSYAAEGAAPESLDSLRATVSQMGINYPCAIGTESTKAQLPQFPGYPTTVFIGRSGQVRLVIAGLHPYEKLEAICQLLLEEQLPEDQ